MDWDMLAELGMSTAESWVLFGTVAATMKLLLGNDVIKPFK
jgi:hypothetical protein